MCWGAEVTKSSTTTKAKAATPAKKSTPKKTAIKSRRRATAKV